MNAIIISINFCLGPECHAKFQNIRDYYNRIRGKSPGTGSSGALARKRIDLLSFLDEYSLLKRT